MARKISYINAITEAIHEEMARDDRVVLIGEDVELGGAFGMMTGLVEEFGRERVRNTPISEAGFTGVGVGLAATGWRPIIDLGFGSFAWCAMDQLCNQAAKWRYMSGGQVRLPIVYRMATGIFGGAAAQHSATLYSQFLQVPGLKVVVPSNPEDMKGLLKSAIRDPNPVLVFEGGRLIGEKGDVRSGDHTVPLGAGSTPRSGTDVTVVAIGYMVKEALAAAELLEASDISVEVVDPRTLVPLDRSVIVRSVKRTGRLVVVDESTPAASAASEIIASVCEAAHDQLVAAPRRVCTADVPIPFAPEMEKAVVPDAGSIVSAIEAVVGRSIVTSG
jgi:pyruvate dehydrogenase E1 component beta subunit